MCDKYWVIDDKLTINGIEYKLISSDYLKFDLLEI